MTTSVFKKTVSALIFFAAAFLALRFFSLLTAIEASSYPEELIRGTNALQILAGSKTPILEYQTDTYMGGSVAITVLAALFFSVFGKSLFVLKIIPLICFFLPAFVLMFLFLRENFGTRAAVCGALLFLFPVPVAAQLSVAAMGFHSESILFSAGILYFYYRCRQRPESKGLAAALGFFCGFGVWFTPTVLLSIAACAVTDIFSDRGRLLRAKSAWILWLFFILGYSPGIFYNLTHRFEGLHYVANGFLTRSQYEKGVLSFAASFGERLFELIVKTLPRAAGFRRQMGELGFVLSVVYLIGSFVAWLGTTGDFVRKKELRKILPVILYPVLFLFSYAASSFFAPEQTHLGQSRYFVPFYFYLTITSGIYGAGEGKLRKIIFAALLGLGAAGYATLIFKSDFGLALRYRGYYESFFELNQKPGEHKILFPELQQALLGPDTIIRSVSDGMRCYTVSQIGEDAALRYGLAPFVRTYAKKLLPEDQACFYEGYTRPVSQIALFYFSGLAGMEDSSRQFFCRRLGRLLLFPKDDPQRKVVDQKSSSFSEQELKWIYQGLGEFVVLEYWSPELRGLDALYEFLDAEIPRENLQDFYWGLGWGLGIDTHCDRESIRNWIKRLPLEARASAQKGFLAAEDFYNIRNVCLEKHDEL